MAGNRQVDFQSNLSLHGNELKDFVIETFASIAEAPKGDNVSPGRIIAVAGKLYTYTGGEWVVLTPLTGTLPDYIEEDDLFDNQGKIKGELISVGINGGQFVQISSEGLSDQTGEGYYVYLDDNGGIHTKSLAGIYVLKGSTADLISKEKDAKKGDVWNCTIAITINQNETYPAGTNWVYVGDKAGEYTPSEQYKGLYNGVWDPLGGVVDLSGFIQVTSLEQVVTSGETGKSKIPSSYAVATELDKKVTKLSADDGLVVLTGANGTIKAASIDSAELGTLAGVDDTLSTRGSTLSAYITNNDAALAKKETTDSRVEAKDALANKASDDKYPTMAAASAIADKAAETAVNELKEEIGGDVSGLTAAVGANTAAITTLNGKVDTIEKALPGKQLIANMATAANVGSVDKTEYYPSVAATESLITTAKAEVKNEVKTTTDALDDRITQNTSDINSLKTSKQDAKLVGTDSFNGSKADDTSYPSVKAVADAIAAAKDELGGDVSDIEETLEEKADITYVDEELKKKADKVNITALNKAYKVQVNTQGIVTGGTEAKLDATDLNGLEEAKQGQLIAIGESNKLVAVNAAPAPVSFTGGQVNSDSGDFSFSTKLNGMSGSVPVITLYSVSGNVVTIIYTRIDYDTSTQTAKVWFNKKPETTENFRLVFAL